ncbi:MAG: acyl-CoA dehydrogenase family protein [Caulobacterales bacterium]|jgi:alkylation response protein AidB-like acyl-CoA dehydrogenase
MNLEFSADEVAFQEEVRTFIAQNYPKSLRGKATREDLSREDFLAWHKILGQKGWVAPAWPVQYGGPGWSPTQRYIFAEELARAETVPILPFGINMVGPVIYTFGSVAQKERFLPKILAGEEWWCQGYSEPGAGSDLANLRTKAERKGDTYIVNGMKTWTTLAQYADWGFFLCRTDPDAKKPQEGISFLLINMKSPGITVRPIIMLDGGHEVNEVYLDNVEVPADQLVGLENQGWTYAKFLLAHERSGIAGVARSKRGVERLKDLAKAELADDGRALITDGDFKRKIADLEIDLLALEFTELRVLANEQAGKGPGPESSLLKIKGTEIQQRLTELAMEAVGNYTMPYFRGLPADTNEFPIGSDAAHHTAPLYFNMRKTSIYGGSNEIQRNIIAKMVLGL